MARLNAVQGMKTMDLQTKINASLKDAIKAKDGTRVSTLRLVNAAIKDREIARRGEDDAAGDGQAAPRERARLRRGRPP